jgi:hypothetical protein
MVKGKGQASGMLLDGTSGKNCENSTPTKHHDEKKRNPNVASEERFSSSKNGPTFDGMGMARKKQENLQVFPSRFWRQLPARWGPGRGAFPTSLGSLTWQFVSKFAHLHQDEFLVRHQRHRSRKGPGLGQRCNPQSLEFFN